MRYRTLAFIGLMILVAVACTPAQQAAVQTMVAAAPQDEDPLGGAVGALPSPDPAAVPPDTPAPSSFSLPTAVPTASGPLAALTQAVQLIPTQDTSATPYAIAYEGRPHFIEFHARW